VPSGGLLVGDDDGTVPARPQALTPKVESPSLLGDVGVHELHEPGEIVGARRGAEKMGMRGHDDEGVDGHLVDVLGLADDAEDDVGQLGRRFE
jgi:hypothetical protein